MIAVVFRNTIIRDFLYDVGLSESSMSCANPEFRSFLPRSFVVAARIYFARAHWNLLFMKKCGDFAWASVLSFSLLFNSQYCSTSFLEFIHAGHLLHILEVALQRAWKRPHVCCLECVKVSQRCQEYNQNQKVSYWCWFLLPLQKKFSNYCYVNDSWFVLWQISTFVTHPFCCSLGTLKSDICIYWKWLSLEGDWRNNCWWLVVVILPFSNRIC